MMFKLLLRHWTLNKKQKPSGLTRVQGMFTEEREQVWKAQGLMHTPLSPAEALAVSGVWAKCYQFPAWGKQLSQSPNNVSRPASDLRIMSLHLLLSAEQMVHTSQGGKESLGFIFSAQQWSFPHTCRVSTPNTFPTRHILTAQG